MAACAGAGGAAAVRLGVGSSSGCDARRGGGTGEGAAGRHDAATDGTRKKMGWVSKRTDHKFARILNTQRWEEKILLKDVYDSRIIFMGKEA